MMKFTNLFDVLYANKAVGAENKFDSGRFASSSGPPVVGTGHESGRWELHSNNFM